MKANRATWISHLFRRYYETRSLMEADVFARGHAGGIGNKDDVHAKNFQMHYAQMTRIADTLKRELKKLGSQYYEEDEERYPNDRWNGS